MVRVVVIIFMAYIILLWLGLTIEKYLTDREWRFTWIRDDKAYKIEQVIIMQGLDMVVLKMREKGSKRKYYLKCNVENWDWFKERRYKG